jgi:hypothetical protein
MSHVPSWVYILFLVLLYIGITGCFKRVVKVNRLILMPAVFVWFSVDNLYKASTVSLYQIVFFIFGGLIGIYLGYLHVRKAVVHADKHQHLVELPGDWTILILILIIFAVQFAVHYLLAADPSIANNNFAMGFIMLVSGATTGMVVGRNLTYFHKFTKAHHEHLHLKKTSFFK